MEEHVGGMEGSEEGVTGWVVLLAEVCLGVGGCEPAVGEGGGDGRFAAVFGEVRERGALGDGAEGLGVLAFCVDVFVVEGDEGVVWGVVLDPEEGLGPGVGVVVGVGG